MGRDISPTKQTLEGICFNSRAHAWGATIFESYTFPALEVSIHAPTHGARPNFFRCIGLIFEFQFTRPRMGRDHFANVRAESGGGFQFTRPRMGRDQEAVTLEYNGQVFQFTRPRMGRDRRLHKPIIQNNYVSIHAPTHGARPS